MHEEILRHLQGITEEEQAILDGRTTIDRELYMQGGGSENVRTIQLVELFKYPHGRYFPKSPHGY